MRQTELSIAVSNCPRCIGPSGSWTMELAPFDGPLLTKPCHFILMTKEVTS